MTSAVSLGTWWERAKALMIVERQPSRKTTRIIRRTSRVTQRQEDHIFTTLPLIVSVWICFVDIQILYLKFIFVV